MAENNKIYTLDERIENNLKEIYENEIVPLKEIIEFVEQYKKFKLSGAEKLCELFKTKTETEAEEVISTHGLPGFFAGKRDADTVMLMLNPGQDVALANNPMITYERIMRGKKIGKGININSLDDFISTYRESSIYYGEIDEDRADNFDLKQAAFLKHWKDCGVDLAGFLDDNYKKLVDNYKNYKKLGKADKEEIEKIKEEIDKINKEAKKNVLMEKLSMDLIPYASRKFDGIDPDQIPLLFPYLETLFDEIFKTKRKYVIFCSDFYKNLFKQYNGKGKWIIEGVDNDDNKKSTNTVFDQKAGKKERLAYCTPIIIRQKDNGNQQNAIIAHTFPNQSLPNAYEKMEEYGRFCFKVWTDEFGEI
ncbi:hypothetical protein SAMN04487902_10964 [Prevotella sp. ne3005]|uniref:hypothetical protein n=1 Tax=Prevotella sp. ne3005 TaxID=1761887 RepID=UPI0008B92B9B|nr:hypothetical protein [Prevotella sp. ne3005]SEN23625.1 hypothetical protein SAMN04487902_10964 [Prevotella sp. ne3005]